MGIWEQGNRGVVWHYGIMALWHGILAYWHIMAYYGIILALWHLLVGSMKKEWNRQLERKRNITAKLYTTHAQKW
jgi:hypothetical protein